MKNNHSAHSIRIFSRRDSKETLCKLFCKLFMLISRYCPLFTSLQYKSVSMLSVSMLRECAFSSSKQFIKYSRLLPNKLNLRKVQFIFSSSTNRRVLAKYLIWNFRSYIKLQQCRAKYLFSISFLIKFDKTGVKEEPITTPPSCL